MKNFLNLRHLGVLLLLLCNMSVFAGDLVTKQVVINVDAPGSLSNKIGSTQKYNITSLKLIGELNGADVSFIRDMAGCNIYGGATRGHLEMLDLEDADIIKGNTPFLYHQNGLIGYGPTWIAATIDNDNWICSYMFENCVSLKSIVLPKNTIKIADYAFYGCTALSAITLSSKLDEVRVNAFYGSNRLSAITIGNLQQWVEQYNSIGSRIPREKAHLFMENQEILDLKIPSTITKIDSSCFSAFSYLSSVSIPNSIVVIGKNAFEDCIGLRQVNIESLDSWLGVKFENETSNPLYYAGDLCLNGKSLDEAIIEEKKNICDYAFIHCTSLKKLVISFGTNSIGGRAFLDCNNLVELSLPSSLTSIGVYAFGSCCSLKNLIIPSSVTSISSGAFEDCSGLTNLSLPSSVTSISSGAFSGCSGLTNLSLPSSVTLIGSGAFQGCSSLTSLSLPSNVTSIGSSAFDGCSSLRSIYAYMTEPQNISSDVFDGVDKHKCVLYVPKGCRQNFWLTDGWGDFENIVEYDVTGIDKTMVSSDVNETSRYSVNGQRLTAPIKGVNIVKYSDGSVRKEIVK